jgi:hypothetical protein
MDGRQLLSSSISAASQQRGENYYLHFACHGITLREPRHIYDAPMTLLS